MAFQQVVGGAVYEKEWFLLGSAIALSQHRGVSVVSSKSFSEAASCKCNLYFWFQMSYLTFDF